MDVQAYLEADQTAKLEAATVCLRDRILVRFPRQLGCRISEAIGIAVEDINFEKSQLTIEHLKARIKLTCPKCGGGLGKKSTFCPGCGSKVESLVQKQSAFRRVRTIPIDKETLELVRQYIEGGGPVKKNGRLMLFDMSRIRAWQIFTEAANKAGLPKILNQESGKVHNVSPHKLRDAFAVNAIKHDNTTDGARLLQEQLGHKDIGTTLKYRKVAGEELHDWYDKLMQEKK
jgi:integrase/recombinase XerD